MATSTNTSLRRSPRKKAALVSDVPRSPEKKQRASIPSPKKQAQPNSRKNAREDLSPMKSVVAKRAQSSIVPEIPVLPRNADATNTTVTSNNRRSPDTGQSILKFTHVDSLLLPLRALASEGSDAEIITGSAATEAGLGAVNQVKKLTVSVIEKAARTSKGKPVRDKRQPSRSYVSRFVLAEARCNDDDSDSRDEQDEDEDTDLSGFIVPDDAEISYHGSSSSESDDWETSRSRVRSRTTVRRRLQRGSPTRRQHNFSVEVSDSDKENGCGNTLSNALGNMHLDHEEQNSTGKREIEIIDLTWSPVHARKVNLSTPSEPNSDQFEATAPTTKSPRNQTRLEDLDAIPKLDPLDPPIPKPSLTLPPRDMPFLGILTTDNGDGKEGSPGSTEDEFKTPPATPPQSPSKLKSPSKLLSPSKSQTIPQSPHRQSMDAFWDHNVVNEWNDTYSPKKAPATSPRKRLFAPFTIFSDSGPDLEKADKAYESSDSLPSPCSSPRKSRSRPQSPMKSPEKEAKKRLLEEKRAAAARKKDFDSRKAQMAVDLLHELDTNVAESKLTELASSTGGVKIIWSKTLRSTAGRANWKRTVTKLSGSPVKGGEKECAGGLKVQHFACIELAEKIIDCDDRLVNTLAHEFCHLANFMISNVRDQPHGASFKEWAARVTRHLRQSEVPVWRQVQVTTKHSYVINHKYLWVCVGRRDRTAAMDFLNLGPDEGGCGAEYGRHSKSIDTEKHRCGKCKGRLVQVKPQPRASPRKKSRTTTTGTTAVAGREGSADSSGSAFSIGSGSRSGSRSSSGRRTGSVLGSMIETVELSD